MDQGDRLIGDHLDAVRAALWRSLMLKNLLSWVACVMATCLIFVVVDQWIYAFGTLARSLLAGTVICGSVGWLMTRIVPLIRLRISPEYASFSVEQDAPDLHHALTS